ncbi:MAG: AbrB family transcriptional regulator [Chloroflexaceae bacterium]|nr:AbrB family transcriptional regulator [Chloroflexaceae bacterium]
MRQSYKDWLIILGSAVAAGALLNWLGIAAGWFLGPMISTAVFASLQPSEQEYHLPEWVYNLSMAVLGGAVSTALTPDAVEVLVRYWLLIVLAIVALLTMSILTAVLLTRFSDLDLPTTVLGMLPGGAPGMVALSDAMHADTRLVAVMQSIRLMLVLGMLGLVSAFVVPLVTDGAPIAAAAYPAVPDSSWQLLAMTVLITIGGAWGGARLHLPAGTMVGPALLGAVLGLLGVRQAPWPELILVASYILIGLSVGLQFDITSMRTVGRLLPVLLLSMLVLIIGGALLGGALALFTSVDLFSAFLATTPGGLNMVTIIALESGSNVVLVLTLNLLRFLVIILTGPLLVRGSVRLFGHSPA